MASNQSNPRKFSEKIALHNQKQAEETAAFEKIMQEVGSATSRSNANSRNGVRTTQHLGISSINSSCRGGSLPNVNSPSNSTPSVDLQSALHNLQEIQSGREGGYRERRQGIGSNAVSSGGISSGPGPGPGPLRSRPMDARRVDSSSQLHSAPYAQGSGMLTGMSSSMNTNQIMDGFAVTSNGGSHLLPPAEPSWRRTHSDSALHQASMTSSENLLLGVGNSPIMPRKSQEAQNSLLAPDLLASYGLSSGVDGRPKSCCDVSRMTNDTYCPQVTDTISVQIPMSNNTGSLPDLTNLQFPSPIPNPLDHEESSQSQTQYATSPNFASSGNGMGSNFDLPGINSMNTMNMGSGGLSPRPAASSRGSSPGPSLSARRRPRYQVQNLYNKHYGHQTSQPQSPNLLTVPSIVISSKFLHSSKGMTLDNSVTPLPGYNYLCQGSPADYSQPTSPMHSPGHVPQSQPISMHGSLQSPHRNQSLLRPTSQTLPTLVVPGSMAYRSSSPGDTSLVNSAPPSPVSQSLSPASSPGLASSPSPFTDMTVSLLASDQGNLLSGSGHNDSFFQNEAKALQHQLEHFTMMNTRSDLNNQQYGYYKPNNMYQASMRLPLNMDTSLDALAYDNTSHGLFGSRSNLQGQQPTSTQTPQTPSSIPEIIIDDFFSTGVDALRAVLDPINFDDQQMLTDPDTSIVTDPATEDHFRLDRL